MGVASREHSTVVVKLPPKGQAAPLTLKRDLLQIYFDDGALGWTKDTAIPQ